MSNNQTMPIKNRINFQSVLKKELGEFNWIQSQLRGTWLYGFNIHRQNKRLSGMEKYFRKLESQKVELLTTRKFLKDVPIKSWIAAIDLRTNILQYPAGIKTSKQVVNIANCYYRKMLHNYKEKIKQ